MSNKHSLKKIHLTEGALEQLQAERMQKVQMHLDEAAKTQANLDIARDLVLRAAIEHHGLPKDDESRRILLDAVEDLASAVWTRRMRQKHNAVDEVLRLNNITEVPPHMVWAAAKFGVHLGNTQHPVVEESPLTGGSH